MEWVAKLLELLKTPTKLIFGAWVACSIFVFGSDSLLNSLGLLRFREQGKTYFGILFLLLTASIVGFIVWAATDIVLDYLLILAGRKRLTMLTREEKHILKGYIEGETRTLYLEASSGVVRGLADDKIIYRVSSVSSPMHGLLAFAYNIQPWAWEHLNEHRDLLG